jgi:hypothetical protein
MKDTGIRSLSIFAAIIALALLGTVFNVEWAINIMKFCTPLIMILCIIGAGVINSKKERLLGPLKDGRDILTHLEESGEKILPMKDPLYYKLCHAGYITIVILLASNGNFWLAFFWLITWAATFIAYDNNKEMWETYDEAKRRQQEQEK